MEVRDRQGEGAKGKPAFEWWNFLEKKQINGGGFLPKANLPLCSFVHKSAATEKLRCRHSREAHTGGSTVVALAYYK